jgi:hypothetical protein
MDQVNTAHIVGHRVTPEEVEQVFANDEMALTTTSPEERIGGQ